jgi:hypothetical protein
MTKTERAFLHRHALDLWRRLVVSPRASVDAVIPRLAAARAVEASTGDG